MIDNNEDPIKEYKTFRPGLDNLIEDNDTDFDMNTFSSSRGFHECSDDLSDRGSKLEEIAHAKYAEYRRQASQNKYNTYNRVHSNKVIVDAKNKWVVYLIIFLFIILPILQTVFGTIALIFSSIADEFNYDNDNDYSSSYNYEYMENEQDFESVKNQIKVDGTMLSYDETALLVETVNSSNESLSNVQVQVIFYNGENQPIGIQDFMIDTLGVSSRNLNKLYDIPEKFERYDFIVSQPYKLDKPNIDFNDIVVNLTSEDSSYLNFEVTNNSASMIDIVEIGILYIKGNQVIDFETENVYDIKSGKTEEEESYQYLTRDEYDRIEYFVNDISIY